jgi:iron complex outermembrane receptor protein
MARRLVSASALICLAVCSPGAAWSQEQPADLSALSLAELADIETTTSTRTPTELFKVPAAVYVITQEDIRRSGVTSIPEALRLAPGVQVARIDANKWAIGLRGFGSRLSRSMLVMIDGRAVYTPLFAGTYWEVQDVLLADVDRIEVVLGPGGTLWGANAVNGIVNIITRSAKDTQGTLLAAESGSDEQAMQFRYGGRSRGTNYRAYGKFFKRESLFHADGADFDDWRMGQAGFRADWSVAGGRTMTLQGDAYRGSSGQRTMLSTYEAPFIRTVNDDAEFSGGNVLGRWGGPAGRSDVRVQWFFDHTYRKEPTFQETRNTGDVDFQYRLPLFGRNQILWGAGYRVSDGNSHGLPSVRFVPDRRTDQLVTWFVQDDIDVAADRVRVTVGSKFEHNDYSGFEVQPTARVLWTLSTRQTVAASITRAVRTPSRVEHDLDLTSFVSANPLIFVRILPNKDFQPERLSAYEMEYRVQPTSALAISWSGFVNRHRDLLTAEPGTPFPESEPLPAHLVVPFVLGNGLRGESYGLELTSTLSVAPWWRFNGAYSHVHIDLTASEASRDTSSARSNEGSSPRHQAFVHSAMNLASSVEFDWTLRAVSALGSQKIPAYATSDIRIGRTLGKAISLALVGRDLHAPHHAEFATGGTVFQVRRTVQASINWRW